MSEEEIYDYLGMQWVPPPLREGGRELAAALKQKIPRLVQISDLHGEIYSCPSADKAANETKLALAAVEHGYEYFAVSDIIKDVRNFETMNRRNREIERLKQEVRSRISILRAIELDVGDDGKLNYPFDDLGGVDIVIASVRDGVATQTYGQLTRRPYGQLTRRLLAAIEHPRVNVLRYHADPGMGDQQSTFDHDAVARAASRHEVALKFDANPEQISLPDDCVRRLVVHDAKLAISTSARCINDLMYMRLGVAAAQRGWARSEHVINAWPLKRLQKFLHKDRCS
jgi:DNA polymerase (family 10)